MKTLISLVTLIAVAYLVSWSIAYLWLMGSDFRYYSEYLRLAWTSPGEIPSFLQIISITATALIVLLVVGVHKYQGSKRTAHQKGD